jgi:CLIP-associating protein 1/2
MAAASKSLYLQGIRALIRYVPHHFKNSHIDSTVEKLLECSKGTSSYEQVHAAERALENMAESKTIDPEQCMQALSKHLLINSTTDENTSVTLLTLRALTKLIGRLPSEDITKALPSLKPALFASLNGGEVDMRKAAVFLIVEMHSRLGEDVMQELDGLTASQQKLVSIYINRRKQTG